MSNLWFLSGNKVDIIHVMFILIVTINRVYSGRFLVSEEGGPLTMVSKLARLSSMQQSSRSSSIRLFTEAEKFESNVTIRILTRTPAPVNAKSS